jgi:hypothetical protein
MSVIRIYRTEVEVPNKVWEEFGDTQEFERAVLAATEGSDTGGTDYYSDVWVWAEFSSLVDAECCEHLLRDVMRQFAAKLI